MTKGFTFSLPVSVVVLAIFYIYFTTVFIFIDRWFGLMSSPGLMNAIVFTAVALMCVFSYTVAILRDPGRVPADYMPDVEDDQNPMHEIKRKMYGSVTSNDYIVVLMVLELHLSGISVVVSLLDKWIDRKGCIEGGDLRYCQKCSHYKPPRAHHCRVCKRCVLRMVRMFYVITAAFYLKCPGQCVKVIPLDCKDHHCIWISNCVGHANYKVFFIFVLYAVVACIYSMVLLVGSLTNDSLEDELQTGGSFRTAYVMSMTVISGLLLVPLSVALSVLLGWHIYLIFHNKTTIEYHEGVRALWLAEKGGTVYKHPYDLGIFENLTSVLGPNIFSWVCPSSRHIGSGLNFRTAYHNAVGASMSK
ncbi:hypothetical protein WN944_003998 [Citrus x changshan-huyou]|uniref:S-acyltransferase n=1 Tax=Citrus x changshan-huyou TaxID=2935761 RepID=A0AAP0M0M1_9ROSI